MRHVLPGMLALLLALPSALEAREVEARFPEARGFGYLGGFFVTTIDTSVSVFSADLPLGARIDLNRDLGFSDSDLVPRATLGWRFGERHLLSGGWYRIRRDSSKELDVTIPLPPGEEFPIDALVDSVFETELYKVQYTWLFHKDSRVTLGLSGGLFIASLELVIDGEEAPPEDRFSGSFTAPLPVLGGRLTYQLTARSNLIGTADWFFIAYGDYAGVLGDFQVFYTHRTFKHVGFAGGINVLSQRVEVEDDDLLWEFDQGLVGFLAALTFYF